MNRIGIDPGISGAIAILDNSLELLAVRDMPVMALSKNRNQINAAELVNIIRPYELSVITAYVEAVSAMPGQGVSSMFSFGMSYGIIQGVLAALNIPMVLVRPAVWKARAGLKGAEKDMSRTIAQRLYPKAELGLKKHIGRAEAILIARFGG